MEQQPDNGISLKDFLKKNKLPQVVRVVSGMYDMADEISLARDEILILHSLNKYETVKTTDVEGHAFYLPLNVTSRVAIVSKTSWRQSYEDVETLSDEFPSLVVSTQEHACLGIDQGDILKLIHTRYTGPREGYLQCALVNKPQRDDILIPLSYSAMFETVESSDQNSLFLKEVVTNYMLPIEVRFLENRLTIQKSDVNFCRPTGLDKLGIITLHCQSDINLVIATTTGQDPSKNQHSLISIPDDLDIKVVPSANTTKKRTKRRLSELDSCDINFVYGSTIISEKPILPVKTAIDDSDQDIPPPLPPRICVVPDDCQCDSCHGSITEDNDSGATASTDNINDVCHGNSYHDNNTTSVLVTAEISGSDVVASTDCSDDGCHGNSSHDNIETSATVNTESNESDAAASVDSIDDVSHSNGNHGDNEDSVLKNIAVEGEDGNDGGNVLDKLLNGTLEAKSDGHLNMGADSETDDDQHPESGDDSGSTASVTQQKLDELKRIAQEQFTVDKETLENLSLDHTEPLAGLVTYKIPSIGKSQSLSGDQSSGFSNRLLEENGEHISGESSSKDDVGSSQDQNASSSVTSMDVMESKTLNSSVLQCSSDYQEIRELVNTNDGETTTSNSIDAPGENNLEKERPSLPSSRFAFPRCNTLPSLFRNPNPKNSRKGRLKKMTNFARSLKRSQSTADVSNYSYESVSTANANKETEIGKFWSLRRGHGKKTEPESRTRWYV